jgi:hypothetical protein
MEYSNTTDENIGKYWNISALLAKKWVLKQAVF